MSADVCDHEGNLTGAVMTRWFEGRDCGPHDQGRKFMADSRDKIEIKFYLKPRIEPFITMYMSHLCTPRFV